MDKAGHNRRDAGGFARSSIFSAKQSELPWLLFQSVITLVHHIFAIRVGGQMHEGVTRACLRQCAPTKAVGASFLLPTQGHPQKQCEERRKTQASEKRKHKHAPRPRTEFHLNSSRA